MASKKGSGSSVTAPKGRPTAARGQATSRGRRLSPTMEWVLAIVVILAVIAGLFVLFGDVRSPLGGGHSGLGPTVEPPEIVVTTPG